MNFVYSKQATKFLSKIDPKTKTKIQKAVCDTKIHKKLAPVSNFNSERYGVKIEHYRAIIEKTSSEVKVVTIDTKTNMKRIKYGYF